MPEGDIILGNNMPSMGQSLALAVELKQKERERKDKEDANALDLMQRKQEAEQKQIAKNLSLEPEFVNIDNQYNAFRNNKVKNLYDKYKSDPNLVRNPEMQTMLQREMYSILEADKQFKNSRDNTFKAIDEFGKANKNFDVVAAKNDAQKKILEQILLPKEDGDLALRNVSMNPLREDYFGDVVGADPFKYALNNESAITAMGKLRKEDNLKFTDSKGGVKNIGANLAFASEVVEGKNGMPEVRVRSEDAVHEGGVLKMLKKEDFDFIVNQSFDNAAAIDKTLQNDLKDKSSWLYTSKESPLYNEGKGTAVVSRQSPIYEKLLRGTAYRMADGLKGNVNVALKEPQQTTINKISVFNDRESSSASGGVGGKKESFFVDGFAKIEDKIGEGKKGYNIHRENGKEVGTLLNNLDAKVVETLLTIANKTSDAGEDGERGKDFGQRDLLLKRNSDGSYTLINKNTKEELPRITKEDFNLQYNETLGNPSQVTSVKTGQQSKSNAVPKNNTAASKSIKESDIPTKAAAAGYSVKEYKELLKQKGINITQK